MGRGNGEGNLEGIYHMSLLMCTSPSLNSPSNVGVDSLLVLRSTVLLTPKHLNGDREPGRGIPRRDISHSLLINAGHITATIISISVYRPIFIHMYKVFQHF